MADSTSIVVVTGEVRSPADRAIEIVERKGIGHPDTMTDLVADTFCYRYAQYCQDRFGWVPNHSADKVTLAGADAVVRLGGYDIEENVHAYLFGKVTRRVAGQEIPVEDIFADTVDDVLSACTRYPQITRYITKHVQAVVGNPIDHHPGYYQPESTAQLESILTTERLSNDTVACAGGAGRTPVEQLVVDVENYVQGPEFAEAVPGTGSDVKVLATRVGETLDVTMCLPFHPEAVTSWEQYDASLAEAKELVTEFLQRSEVPGVDKVTLHVNGRDVPGRGYLAPFGTCLGKGDCGAVGRGNRYSGVISLMRSTSVEAPAGKNLMHHTGKLYTILAGWIAQAIREEFGVDSEVVVTTRVGSALDRPAGVWVNLADGALASQVRALVEDQVANIHRVSEHLLMYDPMADVLRSSSGGISGQLALTRQNAAVNASAGK